jgi:IS30 family transposase
MTKKYKQLNLEQRYKIEAYLALGLTQFAIAVLVNISKSTVSRELSRNTPKRGAGAKVYNAHKAHTKAIERHKIKPKCCLFTLPLKLEMKSLMETRKLSPELISATWKKEAVAGVSHECMYQFIWKCKHGNKQKDKLFKNCHKELKHGKRRRKRGNYKDSRGLIPNRVSIEKRSSTVLKRKRFGDMEVDLIMGKNHKSALL